MPTPSTWSRNALPIEDARDFRDPMPAPMQVPNALDDVVADLARAAETYSRCSPGSKSPTPPLRLVPGTIGTMAPTAHVKATTLQAKCGPMLAPTVRHQGGRELPAPPRGCRVLRAVRQARLAFVLRDATEGRPSRRFSCTQAAPVQALRIEG
jgi:hypothetical protein